MSTLTVSEAAALLRTFDNVLILTHVRPDGDTVGCAAALCAGLRALGKTAHLLPNAELTDTTAPYFRPYAAPDGFLPDRVVSTDIAAAGLFPENARPYAERVDLAVDHHPSFEFFGRENIVRPEAGACGELIYDILAELGPITPEIALPLYVAVSTDTGCFQYSNTTAQTLRVAAAVKDAGCEAYPINKLFFGTKSLPRLQLESRLTASMELLAGGKVAICRLPLSWMGELGLTEDDIDSIAGFPRAVEGVEVGVMIREMADGREKISLRTGEHANASAICAHLGGGGHRAAAGATVDLGFVAAKAAVLAALRAEGIEV